MKFIFNIVWVLLCIGWVHCEQTEEIIFAEDFEDFDTNIFDVNKRLVFEGNTLLGNFNNETVELKIDDIKKHKMVTVSMDLYIHDSWDGNTSGVNGPDTWTLSVGDAKERFETLMTSFSNSACNTNICLLQAYPMVFPYPNDPKTGVVLSYPGLCHFSSNPQGTSVYRVSYSFLHSDSTLILKLADQLVQSNTSTPKCDESWSIDNLTISIS